MKSLPKYAPIDNQQFGYHVFFPFSGNKRNEIRDNFYEK